MFYSKKEKKSWSERVDEDFKRIDGKIKWLNEEKRTIGKFLVRIKERVYCQECGEERTKLGGFVTEDGILYCSDVPWCLEKNLLRGTNFLPPGLDFFNPIEIQNAIREGILREYKLPVNLK
jgi:hypothetical protein